MAFRLLTTYYLRLTAYCLLLTTYAVLLNAHNLLLTDLEGTHAKQLAPIGKVAADNTEAEEACRDNGNPERCSQMRGVELRSA